MSIGSEIYNCTLKNTNKVSIIIIMVNKYSNLFSFIPLCVHIIVLHSNFQGLS